jgi:hypothetical protein
VGLRRRVSVACTVLLMAIATGCVTTRPPATDDDAPGPEFVISSPTEGAVLSGATFFEVQVLDVTAATHVEFMAGDRPLAPQHPGEHKYRVFLIASDYDDGPLTLEARVTDTAGATARQQITVEVVAEPPGQAVVSTSGAVLGAREANGSISTLWIPGDGNAGADVTFESRTQDQVKLDTGIDYEALGVTFLGAQRLTSDRPVSGPLMVGSGGFGPMVQPGQAVVNYVITPDADGSGIAELVVVNSATVAPNGDVVSDPPLVPMFGPLESEDATLSFYSPGIGPSHARGRPGDRLSFRARNLQPFSLFANAAVYESLVEDVRIEMPLQFTNAVASEECIGFGGGGGLCTTVVTFTVETIIPPLPPGPARVTVGMRASTGDIVGPVYDLTIDEAPASDRSVGQAFSEMLEVAALAIDILEEAQDQGLVPVHESPDELRAHLANIAALLDLIVTEVEAEAVPMDVGRSAVPPWLRRAFGGTLALANTGSCGSLSGGELTQQTAINAAKCLSDVGKIVGGIAGAALALSVVGSPLGLGFGAWMFVHVSSKFVAPAAGAYLFLAAAALLNTALSTDGSSLTTGMGAIVPAGGPGAGNVLAPSNSAATQGLRTAIVPQPLPVGRFAVKVYIDGSPLPFTGLSDANGFFTIPQIPEDQSFTAVAIDTTSGAVRSAGGVGGPMGAVVTMLFDFTSDAASTPVVGFGSNVSGTLSEVETHIYALEADAGQVARFGLFTPAPNAWSDPDVILTVTTPSGQVLGTTANRAQYPHFKTILEQELSETGTYLVVVANTTTEPRDYTLGLVDVASPQEVVPGSTGVTVESSLPVLYDLGRYSFESQAFAAVKILLGHPADSDLNATLHLRRPDGGTGPLAGATSSATRSVVIGPRGLVAGGTYTLEVAAAENGTQLEEFLGGFHATLFAPPVLPVPLGQHVAGHVGGHQIATYDLAGAGVASATVAVIVERPTQGVSTYGTLELLNAGGGLVQRRLEGNGAFGYAQFGIFDVASYPAVVVNNLEDAGFDYQLALTPIPVPIDLGADRPVLDAAGSLDVVGEVVSYLFSGGEGEEVELTLSHPDGESLHATLELFASDGSGTRGSRLGTTTTNATTRTSTLSRTLPATGTYLVDVSTLGTVATHWSFDTLDQAVGDFELVLEFE